MDADDEVDALARGERPGEQDGRERDDGDERAGEERAAPSYALRPQRSLASQSSPRFLSVAGSGLPVFRS